MRVALGVVLLLSCSAIRAAASGGMNLTWGPGCFADNPSLAQNFSCSTNSGSHPFTVSFQTGQDIPHFTGVEVVILVQANAASLPAWWQFVNPGSCRANSLTWSTSFEAGYCETPWSGSPVVGTLRYLTSSTTPVVPTGIPSQALIDLVVDQPTPSALSADVEYDAVRFSFDNAATVGPGSCGGCSTGIGLNLVGVGVRTPTGIAEWECIPVNSGCLAWQYGSSSFLACGADTNYGFLCGPVATRRITWGRIQTYYR